MKRKEPSKPYTPPVPPAVSAPARALDDPGTQNAVLEAEDKRHRLTFVNGMSQLASPPPSARTTSRASRRSSTPTSSRS
jgi:hypothetical protein